MNKSFTLAIVNPAEDIPRVIRAFGRLGHGLGECALVIRPLENKAVLIHQENGQAWQWTGHDSDVVRRPETPIAPRDALTLLRQAQQSPGKQGAISLRGMWRGRLFREDGKPRVHLERKIATYGILHIDSDAATGKWKWHIERTEKWFSQTGSQKGSASNLVEAIQRGLSSAMGLLGEACSFRDSHRRAAHDPDYAEKHPIRAARERKDPIERFKPKEPKKRRTTRKKTTGTRTRTSKEASSTRSNGRKTTRKTSAGNGKTAQTANTGNGKATSRVTTGAARGPGRKSNGRQTTRTTKAPTSAIPAPTAEAQAPTAEAQAPTAEAQATQAVQVAAPEIDPAKDKLLMDAFSAALSQAISQLSS